jgi:hypothetical protein
MRFAIDPGDRVALARQAARVSSHSAANIKNSSEIRQRRTAANELHLFRRPRVVNTDVKKLKPLSGIDI